MIIPIDLMGTHPLGLFTVTYSQIVNPGIVGVKYFDLGSGDCGFESRRCIVICIVAQWVRVLVACSPRLSSSIYSLSPGNF